MPASPDRVVRAGGAVPGVGVRAGGSGGRRGPGGWLSVWWVRRQGVSRGRCPCGVACGGIGACVVGRMVSQPDMPVLASWEGTRTVWACWIALYSAVVHGRKSRRTALVVFVLAAVLFGEVVREIFFYGGGAYGGLPLNEAVLLASKIPPAREGSVEVRPVRELNP